METQPGHQHPSFTSSFNPDTILRPDGGHDYIRHYFESEGYSFPTTGKKQYNSRKWQGKQSGRISIYLRGDRWYFKDFARDQGGDCFTLAAIANNYRLPDDFVKAAKDVAAFYGIRTDGDTPLPAPRPRLPKPEAPQHPYEPNNDRNRAPSVSYRYEIDPAGIADGEYPKPIRAATLARYGVQRLRWIEHEGTGYRVTGSSSDPLYLFTAGLNTKIYRPAQFRDRDGSATGKQRPATYAGNYVFGLDQIPQACEYILITAGQNDTLAANDLLNSSGIYAVCLWSESSASYLAPELLAELQSRCKGVFVCYDDDETGNRTAADIRKAYGLPVLKVPHRAGVNDLCDTVQAAGQEWTRAAILEAIEAADKPHFATDYRAEILQHITQHRRAVVAIRTGAGKTFAFLNRDNGLAYELQRLTGKRITFVAPTRALTEQAAAKYHIPCLVGGMDSAEQETAARAVIRATTYDSLPKLLNLTGSSPADELFIVDEFDELVNAQGYRSRAVKTLLDYMQEASQVVCLSATPNPHFAAIGYELLQLDIPTRQRLEIRPQFVTGNAVENLCARLQELDYSQGLHVAYINDIKGAETVAALVAPLLPAGRRVTLINSQEPGEDYHHLTNTGTLPADVALVLFTKFIEAGVNIDNADIKRVFAVADAGGQAAGSYPNPRDLAQFAGRFRKMEAVTVDLMLHPRKGAKEASCASIFSNLYKLATGQAISVQAAQELHRDLPQQAEFQAGRQRYDETYTRTNTINGEIEPDFLRVAHQAQSLFLNSLPTQRYLQELAGLLSYAHILPSVCEAYRPVEAFQEARQEARHAEKIADAKLLHLTLQEPENVMEAAYHSTRKIGVKLAIREHVGHVGIRHISQEAQHLQEEYQEVFSDTSFAPLSFFFELDKLGFNKYDANEITTRLADAYYQKTRDRLQRQITTGDRVLSYWQEDSPKQAERLQEASRRLTDLMETKQAKQEEITAAIEATQDEIRTRQEAGKPVARLEQKLERLLTQADKMKRESRSEKAAAKRIRKATGRLELADKAQARTGDVERARQELATLEATRANNMRHIPADFFRGFVSQLESLKLSDLVTRKATKEQLTPAQLRKAQGYRKFVAAIRKNKGRAITAESIEKAYRKACGLRRHPGDLVPAALNRFKELFEYDVTRDKKGHVRYLITGKICAEKFAQKWGFSWAEFLQKNRDSSSFDAILSENSTQNAGVAKSPINILSSWIEQHPQEQESFEVKVIDLGDVPF